MANWVRYPSPLSERFPLGENAKWRCDTSPLKRGISAIPARYPMKTRQMGARPPSAILSRKGIARYGGGISHWAAKSYKHWVWTSMTQTKTIFRPASSLEPFLEWLLGSSGGFGRKFPEGGLNFLEAALVWKFPYGNHPKQSSKKFASEPPKLLRSPFRSGPMRRLVAELSYKRADVHGPCGEQQTFGQKSFGLLLRFTWSDLLIIFW